MTAESLTQVRERLAELETVLEEQRERITRQEQVIEELRTQSGLTIDRRSALQAGGLLGLLGLGATAGSANPSGQIGTASRPLEALHAEGVESETIETGEIGGPVVDGSSAITSFSRDADARSVPIRDDDGALAVGEGTGDDHAVTQGQDVDWSGEHEFPGMPFVGGAPIVESGSNADGHYTKFADGTFMCWGRDISVTSGSYATTRFDLPISVDTIGFGWAGTEDKSGNDYDGYELMPNPRGWLSDGGDQIAFRLRTSHGNGVTNENITASYFAVGTWS